MSKMIDKVVKLTIQAPSMDEAVELAKSEKGVKKILEAELSTSTFEVVVIQEWYGEHNLGYCQDCGTDLCCRLEFNIEKCEDCM